MTYTTNWKQGILALKNDTGIALRFSCPQDALKGNWGRIESTDDHHPLPRLGKFEPNQRIRP